MTKREAVRRFKEAWWDYTYTLCKDDKPARDQAWNDYTDALCKDGDITQKQYDTWEHPWNERTK